VDLSYPEQNDAKEICQVIFAQVLSSTFALFGERRMPGFPGLTRRATRVFENPAGRAGVQKVEIAGFSRLYRTIRLRKRAEVEISNPLKTRFAPLVFKAIGEVFGVVS
jgi:hypothetical protein